MNRKDAATTFLTLAGSGKVDEDRDFVITLSHVVRGNPSDPDVAVVHVFKFEGDKVVELWDLGQLMSKDSPNRNGMFWKVNVSSRRKRDSSSTKTAA